MLILVINLILTYLLYVDSFLLNQGIYYVKYMVYECFNIKPSYNLNKNCAELYNKYRDLDND